METELVNSTEAVVEAEKKKKKHFSPIVNKKHKSSIRGQLTKRLITSSEFYTTKIKHKSPFTNKKKLIFEYSH